MHGVNKFNSTLSDHASIYSPVMLSNEWPRVGRLVFISSVAALGSTFNAFFVSSFFVEKNLRKAGLTFLACVGLADLLITGGVMFVLSVVLLSGEWDNIYVCNAVQLIGTSATYCYSLFFMLAAAEDYLRLCFHKASYDRVVTRNVKVITLSIFAISFILGACGVYLCLDYDYCNRSYNGNINFRMVSTVLFHILPSGVSITCVISTFLRIRRRAFKKLSYRRSYAYVNDYSIAKLNIIAYFLYVIAWLPYLITSLDLDDASDAKYYHSIWVGQGRSVFTSISYSIFDRNFRHGFAQLFNYVCCKKSLSDPLVTRHRRKNTRRQKTNVRLLHPNIPQDARLHGPPQETSTSHDTYYL